MQETVEAYRQGCNWVFEIVAATHWLQQAVLPNSHVLLLAIPNGPIRDQGRHCSLQERASPGPSVDPGCSLRNPPWISSGTGIIP